MICPRCEGNGQIFFEGSVLPPSGYIPPKYSDIYDPPKWLDCDLCDGSGQISDELELEGVEG